MIEAPLAGVHAVVTGGGRGIGLAIARRLAADGARLTLLGRDQTRLDEAARSMPASAGCVALACDVADAASIARAFATLAGRGRGLAILVNNAGVATSARLAATDDALLDQTLAANLAGTIRCARAALPMLLEASHGRIVNVASTAGLVGYPYVSAYCAAKHGVVGFTRALALELAATRVTVNAVCPGYTDTDVVRDAVANIVARTGRSETDARAALVTRNPQRRLVAPDEVARTVAWLCHPDSQAVNGQAVAIDGGEVAG
ncbi:MAG: SDR family NAD(P)-dependent oxidoreductase [Burkholderiales bacterium]